MFFLLRQYLFNYTHLLCASAGMFVNHKVVIDMLMRKNIIMLRPIQKQTYSIGDLRDLYVYT